MKDFAVHVLFHLLAIAAGVASGIAGGLWWFGRDPSGLWLAVGALVVGIIVLILESLYISVDEQPVHPRVYPGRHRLPAQRRREHTLPDLEPVPAANDRAR